MEDNELLKVRREKITALKEAGIDLYPNDIHPQHTTAEILEKYGAFKGEELAELGQKFSVAGRLMAVRDFGKAAFIIDDTDVENRNAHVFMVNSGQKPFKPEGISSLKRNQEKINISLPGPCLVTVTNSNIKRYIRFGPNQNSGSPQTDIFIVDKNGNLAFAQISPFLSLEHILRVIDPLLE